MKWNKTSEIKPQQRTPIIFIDSVGEETNGYFYLGRFFIGDLYLYYIPEFWRYEDE